MMAIKATNTPEMKPCPICGTGGDLHTGQINTFSFGVSCNKCGIALAVEAPNFYPRGCKSPEDVYNHTINKAIKKWNQRTKQ